MKDRDIKRDKEEMKDREIMADRDKINGSMSLVFRFGTTT